MGATISKAKFASAFQGPDDKLYYALFEQKYEANCHPHKARWSCVAFGGSERVIREVFDLGATCEDGLRQSEQGWISSTDYIGSWLTELASPMKLPDQTIELHVSDKLDSTVPRGKAKSVIQKLRSLQREDMAQILNAGGSVPISLHAEPQLVEVLSEFNIFPSFSALERLPASVRAPELGYSPEPVKPNDVPPPVFMKLDGDIRLLQEEDGTWRSVGWSTSITYLFIKELAVVELSCPQSYKTLIPTFLKALKNAKQVPASATAIIDLEVPLESPYADKRRRTLIAEHGIRLGIVKTDKGFEIPCPKDRADLDLLTSLPASCVVWEIPELPADNRQRKN